MSAAGWAVLGFVGGVGASVVTWLWFKVRADERDHQ